MRFEFPWAFLILPILIALLWFTSRRQRGGLKFSSVQLVASSGPSFRAKLRHVPRILRIAAVVLLTVALARPQQGREEVRDVSQGIAIEMVVDRSGSMGQ